MPKAPDTLLDWSKSNGVRGVRMFPGRKKGLLDDPKTFPVWERAVSLGIPITVACNLDEMHKMPAVVANFPKAQGDLLRAHVGREVRASRPSRRSQPVLALARFPNVYLKLCPNNSYALREAKGTPKGFYGALVDAFGASRIMWGSNYPAHWDHYGPIEDRLPLMQEDFVVPARGGPRAPFFGETALTRLALAQVAHYISGGH